MWHHPKPIPVAPGSMVVTRTVPATGARCGRPCEARYSAGKPRNGRPRILVTTKGEVPAELTVCATVLRTPSPHTPLQAVRTCRTSLLAFQPWASYARASHEPLSATLGALAQLGVRTSVADFEDELPAGGRSGPNPARASTTPHLAATRTGPVSSRSAVGAWPDGSSAGGGRETTSKRVWALSRQQPA
jgi:hypothetical protein